jgi:hypothetical protein
MLWAQESRGSLGRCEGGGRMGCAARRREWESASRVGDGEHVNGVPGSGGARVVHVAGNGRRAQRAEPRSAPLPGLGTHFARRWTRAAGLVRLASVGQARSVAGRAVPKRRADVPSPSEACFLLTRVERGSPSDIQHFTTRPSWPRHGAGGAEHTGLRGSRVGCSGRLARRRRG